MEFEVSVQQVVSYSAWFMVALGVLAFVTALIVQAVKELPGLAKAPTSLTAMVVAVVLTMLAVLAAASHLQMTLAWYVIVAAVVVGVFVWYIATNGWDKFSELWQRYKKDAPKK